MISTPCQLLDDYIAHDLTGDARVQFEAHLPACLACQRKIREEQSLDALLSSAVTQLEHSPARLSRDITRALQKARQKRLVTRIAALAACAAVIFLIGRTFLRQKPPEPMTHVVPPPTRQAEAPPSAVQVRVRFPKAADVIAVPVPSESPNVTLVQVYLGFRQGPNRGLNKRGNTPIPQRSEP